MRLVFLFFLLLNIVYFGWQSDYFHKPVAHPSRIEINQPGVASLTLLRERGLGGGETSSRTAKQPSSPTPEAHIVGQAKQTTASPPPVSPATPKKATTHLPPPNVEDPVAMACFTFGPFDKEETVTKAFEAVSAAGGYVKRREVEQRTPKAYWVYLAPLASYNDAAEQVKALRKKGISDLFIMGKGDKQNAISLGLFSSKATADQRFEEVSALGMKPIMDTQFRTSTLIWLDIEVESTHTTTIGTITAIAEEYVTANLSQRDCE